MAFTKYARIPIEHVAHASYTDGTLVFQKSAQSSNSLYQNSTGHINVGELLSKFASKYDLSDNPKDYLFEAVRALTAEVPNQNGDAFPKEELLRQDASIGKPVYASFISKPHQINHRNDNPRTARGIVLDASYNDSSPMLESCPTCNQKTASAGALDSSGLNCAKCGSTVKDEFVELLLAIDTKKDPTFAEGVRTGSLGSLSMGCSAGCTVCSVCDNKARAVSDFCTHIRGGNKKKTFKTASGVDRIAFEKCYEVEFDEISRVDQPADPTALQKEVFDIKAAPQISPFSLKQESEMLIMSTKLAKLEGLLKSAQVNDVDKWEQLKVMHPELSKDIDQLLNGEDSIPKPLSIDDYTKEQAESKSDSNITPGELGMKTDPTTQVPAAGETQTAAVNDTTSKITAELDQMLAKVKDSRSVKNRFASVYKDIKVTITKIGNAKVHTDAGTLFVIRPEVKPTNKVEAAKLADDILSSVADLGLVGAVEKYAGMVSPKIAQVLQHHVEDFAGGREEGDKKPHHEGGDSDGTDVERPHADDTTLSDENTDHQEERAKRDLSDSTAESHSPDHAEGKPDGVRPLTDDPADDGASKARSKLPGSTLQDLHVDFSDKKPKTAKVKTAADKKYISRLNRLYSNRLNKVREDVKTKVSSLEKISEAKTASKMLRALKLAAKRQELNLESSPLKEHMFDVLTASRDLDAESYYPGMDEGTAAHIIEAAASEGFDAFIDSLVKRASELMMISDDAFTVLEKDIKNLRPAAVQVTSTRKSAAAASGITRQAALEGNMPIASRSTDVNIPNTDGRDNIRSALGSTIVRRASQNLLKR